MFREMTQGTFKTPPMLMAWEPWMWPGITVLLGFLVGMIVERLVLSAVREILKHTSIELNAQIAATLRGVIFWLFAMWATYMATYGMPFLQDNQVILVRHLVFVIAMILSIRLLAKVAVTLLRFYLNYSKALSALPNTSIFENIVLFAVYVLGLLMLLQTLGVSIVPIVTALGVGGLAISLALQDTLANLFAGIQMILARQIKVGNTIQLENSQMGEVVDIAWRTTTLRQLSGNLVILPNSKLASNIIINYTQPHPDLAVTLPMSVPLTADLQQVETMSLEVAQTVGLAMLRQKVGAKGSKLANFTPVVRFLSYGESWINMAITMPFPVPLDAGLVKHELFKALHARFMAEKISLPFPQNVVHLDFPNQPNIQAEWLEKIAEKSIPAENEKPA
jgi:small-conductance mechanosensitive channel